MSPSSCKIQKSNKLPPAPAAKRWGNQGQNSFPTSEHQSSLKQRTFRILPSRKSPQSCKTSYFRCQRSFLARSPKAAPAALTASPLGAFTLINEPTRGWERHFCPLLLLKGWHQACLPLPRWGWSILRGSQENWFFPATSSHVGVQWEEWGCCTAGGTSILW